MGYFTDQYSLHTINSYKFSPSTMAVTAMNHFKGFVTQLAITSVFLPFWQSKHLLWLPVSFSVYWPFSVYGFAYEKTRKLLSWLTRVHITCMSLKKTPLDKKRCNGFSIYTIYLFYSLPVEAGFYDDIGRIVGFSKKKQYTSWLIHLVAAWGYKIKAPSSPDSGLQGKSAPGVVT